MPTPLKVHYQPSHVCTSHMMLLVPVQVAQWLLKIHVLSETSLWCHLLIYYDCLDSCVSLLYMYWCVCACVSILVYVGCYPYCCCVTTSWISHISVCTTFHHEWFQGNKIILIDYITDLIQTLISLEPPSYRYSNRHHIQRGWDCK